MSSYNRIAGQRIGRIEALSDGVIAIAMTILVFDLKLPTTEAFASDGALWKAMHGLLPKFVAFALAFMTLGIFWTGQAAQFNYMAKYDRHLAWLTILFLAFVSTIPFVTSVLSLDLTLKSALLLYWANIVALGGTLWLHWRYAYKYDLLNIHQDEATAVNKAIVGRIRTAQLLYAGAAALCFVSTYLSIALMFGIQLNYALGLDHRPSKKTT